MLKKVFEVYRTYINEEIVLITLGISLFYFDYFYC